MSQGFTKNIPIDTDGTLSANSDFIVPSQKAVKTYVDGKVHNLTVTTQTTDYTLALSDAWSIIEVDDPSYVTITIPLNSSVAFPVGTLIWLNQKDAGQAVVAATGGVTMTSPDSYVQTRVQGSTIRLQKVATDTWELAEDLGVYTGLDDDAAAYIAAVGTFSTAEEQYINDWFLAAKANGYYTKYHAVYLFLGGTASAHKWNAVDPQDLDASFRMVFTGSPTHDANGVTWNGTTQYGDTFLVPSSVLSQDSKHFSAYFRAVGDGCNFGAVDGGTFEGDAIMINYANAGTMYWDVSTIYKTVATPGTETGAWSMDRSGSTSQEVRRNDVSIATNGSASTSNVALKITVGARNSSGTKNVHSADNISFFAIGDSFSSAEITSEYNDMVTLQTAFSRNV